MRSVWDERSQWYARFEQYELPSVIQCAVLTNAINCKGPVLETGSGPGLHSETLAKAFLQGQGRVLVSCDFSKAMLTSMKRRYA